MYTKGKRPVCNSKEEARAMLIAWADSVEDVNWRKIDVGHLGIEAEFINPWGPESSQP
jgi:hypothetical protein